MSTGKVGVDYRFFFAVKNFDGDPATGIDVGDFVVTVRNPQNTASSSPAVVEAAGGLYFFDIPAAFSTAHGAGSYGMVYSVDNAIPGARDTDDGRVDFFVASLGDVSVVATEVLDWVKNRRRIDFTVSPPQLVLYEADGEAEKFRMDLTTTNGTEVLAFFAVQHERGVPV